MQVLLFDIVVLVIILIWDKLRYVYQSQKTRCLNTSRCKSKVNENNTDYDYRNWIKNHKYEIKKIYDDDFFSKIPIG